MVLGLLTFDEFVEKNFFIETFFSMESQEISDSGIISFCCPVTQFLRFEKIVQEIRYQGGTGLENFFLWTSTKNKDAPILLHIISW